MNFVGFLVRDSCFDYLIRTWHRRRRGFVSLLSFYAFFLKGRMFQFGGSACVGIF